MYKFGNLFQKILQKMFARTLSFGRTKLQTSVTFTGNKDRVKEDMWVLSTIIQRKIVVIV